MKITSARSWVERLELTRPYTIAYATFTHVEMVFVRLETEDGHLGAGSGTPVKPVTGETMEACSKALAENLEGLLVGEDVRRLPRLLRALDAGLGTTPAARAAADVALHDLYAKLLGLPLVEVLGRAHESLATSITVGIKETVEDAIEEAHEYVGRGFRILKLKTGSSVEKDVEITARIREAVGETVGIRVDANQGYGAKDLEHFLRKTAHLGLEFVEQPLPKEDLDGMRTLSADVRQQCAGDESIMRPAQALEAAAEPRPFGIYNIKLMKCGGVGPALSIAEIARLAGLDLMWGCMDESVISISAALHAALASPPTRYLDLDGSFDLARDLARGGFVLKDGRLSTTVAPGLGVELLEG